MADIVCPITDEWSDCWDRPPTEPDPNVDVVSWLKAEMKDGLEHADAHACLGPFLFGYRDDGTPDFEVFRQRPDGPWLVRRRSDG